MYIARLLLFVGDPGVSRGLKYFLSRWRDGPAKFVRAWGDRVDASIRESNTPP